MNYSNYDYVNLLNSQYFLYIKHPVLNTERSRERGQNFSPVFLLLVYVTHICHKTFKISFLVILKCVCN